MCPVGHDEGIKKMTDDRNEMIARYKCCDHIKTTTPEEYAAMTLYRRGLLVCCEKCYAAGYLDR